MTISHAQTIGTNGFMQIQDLTDTPENTVRLLILSSSPVVIPEMPWAYSIDGVMSSWQSFNFLNTTNWQQLGLIYVGYAATFVLHIGDTGTTQLDGPADFEISLQRGSGIKTVSIKDGDVYKKAIPFVNVDGVWQPAAPMVMSVGEWKEVT